MSTNIKPFKNPIYITRPLLPDYELYTKRLQEIWDSQWLSNGGEQHEKLEKMLLDYLNTPYISLTNNGTTALMIAIKALNIQGEVITTPFSFPATTHALTWNNITPVFCDIDLETMTIDSKKIEKLITKNTTAILAVHVFGIPCDVKAIKKIAKKHGLHIIYDAAHAFGTEIDGESIGNFGDISMFSFHPTKLFHTSEGGALTCNDNNIKQRIELLKNFGIKNEFEVILPGINGKMSEMSALMGQCVLDMVDEEQQKRQIIREQYMSSLQDTDGLTIVSVPENVKNSQQYLVLRIDQKKFGYSRDDLYSHLKKYNVYARKYFYPLISDYPHYNNSSFKHKELKIAKKISQEVLCMPFHGNLSSAEVISICEIIKDINNE